VLTGTVCLSAIKGSFLSVILSPAKNLVPTALPLRYSRSLASPPNCVKNGMIFQPAKRVDQSRIRVSILNFPIPDLKPNT
jgi:hypothetical protein